MSVFRLTLSFGEALVSPFSFSLHLRGVGNQGPNLGGKLLYSLVSVSVPLGGKLLQSPVFFSLHLGGILNRPGVPSGLFVFRQPSLPFL